MLGDLGTLEVRVGTVRVCRLPRPLMGRTTVTVEGRFSPRNRAVQVFVWPVVKPMLRRHTRRILRELDAYRSRRPSVVIR